jgi:hypothetical protein
MEAKQNTIIGRSARVALPDWGIDDLLAKTDTVAHTS